MTTPQPEDLIPTRESLLGRLKDWEDADSWREFYNTYWRLIYNAARRAGLTESEANDVVQETLVSLAKTMPKFKYDPAACSFKTWLQHLARKRIVDQFRKRPPVATGAVRRNEDDSRTGTLERVADPAGLNLDAVWEQEWQDSLLTSATDAVKEKVNPKQYQMFYLYAVKQLPIKEVSRSLRVNAGQVYLAKHRVTALIKKEVKSLEAKLARPVPA